MLYVKYATLYATPPRLCTKWEILICLEKPGKHPLSLACCFKKHICASHVLQLMIHPAKAIQKETRIVM